MAKVEARQSLAKADLQDVLREMLLIRRFEEKVEERFRAGELPGFLHVAIGQEACAVGVCRALEDGDIIASTHRAHGHTLAKGTHPNELMAELYGKTELRLAVVRPLSVPLLFTFVVDGAEAALSPLAERGHWSGGPSISDLKAPLPR